jgi:hypothetical protein
VANISREIAEIELAVRGEEVRDSIVNALNKMNVEMNYINPLYVTLNHRRLQNYSDVYGDGYCCYVDCTGVTSSTFAIPCLSSLEDYTGRYAVESQADCFILHFDTEPPNGMKMVIYYFSEGNYEDGEAEMY